MYMPVFDKFLDAFEYAETHDEVNFNKVILRTLTEYLAKNKSAIKSDIEELENMFMDADICWNIDCESTEAMEHDSIIIDTNQIFISRCPGCGTEYETGNLDIDAVRY